MADSNGDAVRPLRVFCSYAHEDHEFCETLRKHLGQLELQRIIKWWDDRQLPPGADWDGAIRETVRSADIIVFLLSVDFLNSEYCIDTEVRLALDRRQKGEAVVVPILVRSVDYDGSVFSAIHMLPPDVVPIASWESPDDAYTAISKEIRKLANDWDWGPRAAEWWFDVPEQTKEFVGRDALVQQLAGALALGQEPPVVALVGAGGIGKTSVAAKYARESRPRYDLVAWLHAEEESGLEWEFARLADRVGLPSTNMHTARTAFRDWLGDPDRWRDKGWLLVFDNATDEDAVRRLLPELMCGHALITSRMSVWQGLGQQIDVEGLAEDDAVQYLLRGTGSTDEESARTLAAAVRRVPLALEQVVATIQEDQVTLDDYVRRLPERAAT